jgi:beta-phosphoglucomutase family hydrolase
MRSALGLPDRIQACLFDMDGVLTQTASVHAAAWQQMFDEFLRARAERTGEPFVPFDLSRDYSDYIDGRIRSDGTRGFLRSRGIALPEGSSEDDGSQETIHGLSNRKNALVVEHIRTDGVDVFPGSWRYLREVRDAGLKVGVVSASANTPEVLRVTGLESLIGARIDGLIAAREGLAGKPAPDTFLAGAAAVGVHPSAAAVFEDAISGVQAGRAGAFGYVVGVDRTAEVASSDRLSAYGQRLVEAGADRVVLDLADLLKE